jgi:cardiolipin synthase
VAPGPTRRGAADRRSTQGALSLLGMAERVVPLRLAQIPNALTIARFAAIPVFVALLVTADGGHSWPAAILFGAAGVTDQVDGWLARRWHVESRFGLVADPLADRLMIDTAVVGLFLHGRLPWPALALIVVRDLVLIGGYKFVVPRGYELSVNFVGKAATWILYAALAFMLATTQGTDWPYVLFWIGLALALLAGASYAFSAFRRQP